MCDKYINYLLLWCVYRPQTSINECLFDVYSFSALSKIICTNPCQFSEFFWIRSILKQSRLLPDTKYNYRYLHVVLKVSPFNLNADNSSNIEQIIGWGICSRFKISLNFFGLGLVYSNVVVTIW